MKNRDARFLARFLAASRVALGLSGDSGGALDASHHVTGAPAPCALNEMHLTTSQRERVYAVLEAHVPAIRARQKAALRAHGSRPRPERLDQGPQVARAAETGDAELQRLRESAVRELRVILTPYQRVQFARRRSGQRGSV